MAPKAKRVGVQRLVSLGHVAMCATVINAGGILMAMAGLTHSETLAAALYWPWLTFIIVAITASESKANAEGQTRATASADEKQPTP